MTNMTSNPAPEIPPPTGYVLTVRPAPSDVPVEVRVRRALKVLLRTFGLRVTAIHTPNP